MTARILVIEDDAGMRESLKDLFLMENLECEVADTGRKGLALFQSKKPHLVVVDAQLPDVSGFQLCQKLKAEGIGVSASSALAVEKPIFEKVTVNIGPGEALVRNLLFGTADAERLGHVRGQQHLQGGDALLDLVGFFDLGAGLLHAAQVGVGAHQQRLALALAVDHHQRPARGVRLALPEHAFTARVELRIFGDNQTPCPHR